MRLIILFSLIALSGCASTQFSENVNSGRATVFTLSTGSEGFGSYNTYLLSIDGAPLRGKEADKRYSLKRIDLPVGPHKLLIKTGYSSIFEQMIVGIAATATGGIGYGSAMMALDAENANEQLQTEFKNGEKVFQLNLLEGEIYVFQPVVRGERIVDIEMNIL